MSLRAMLYSILLFCALTTAKGFAQGYGPYFDLETAYRAGDISTLIHHFNPSTTPIGSDSLKINNIQIYQLGFETRVPICNEWYAKVNGYYGWILGGNIIEKFRAVGVTDTVKAVGNLSNGNTVDTSACLGFLYPMMDGWRFGFMGGWSYNTQRVKFQHIDIDPTQDGSTYKMFWNGPFVGFETLFNAFWAIDASIGFEYHWPKWHANFDLAGPDVVGGDFSDIRKAPRGNAQIAWLKLQYYLCECWPLGLKFQYQWFDVISGYETPRAGSNAAVGLPPSQVDRIPEAFWWTFDIILSVGYVW